MTSDRLELVKDLLVRISEIPEAERDSFLDRICSDDPGLREEIDSLLRYEATARALQMSSEGARVGPHPADPLGFVGRVVSHYRVVEMIGSGGMGVVYKAEDSKLRRTVALKFLPPHLMLDDRANQRFMQEAHAASALDHPNICTIFDIDRTDDGQLFIAMAHYDGTSVERLIANGPVPLGDVADVGVQVLRGLQAAHEAGIIHRDIKPANLIVSQRGLVKILDFGLAKLRGESGLTRAGAKIGTVSYMSPERLQGHEATAGSDIWAVGVSLYEMLTGRLPFPGEEAAAAYSAENREPERIRSLRPEAPKLLEAVVLRAVEKRPEERYSSAEEFLWHLLPLRDAESRGSGQDLRPSLTKMPRGLSRNRWIGQRRRGALVPIIGACVLVGSFGLLHRLQDRDTLPTFANPTRITVDMGVELFASWSPDGRSLAYQSSRSGDVDVWVAQIGLGEVNRTGDHDGYDGRPSWSPDGSQIAFVSQRDGGGTFVMPAIGGSSRKVSEVWGSMFTVPQWSPDGAEIASVPSDTSRAIEIVDVRTNEVQWLEMPAEQGLMSYQLSWSPSGRFFAYVNVPNLGSSNSRIWILRADGTEGHPVTEPGSYDWCPSWSADERTLYFLSDRGGSRELWRLPLDTNGRPRGAPRVLTTGLGLTEASFSADGTRLAYCQGTRHFGSANLWRVLIPENGVATDADGVQLTFDDAGIGSCDISPDGTHLLFNSDRAGEQDIWILPAEGGSAERLVAHPAADLQANWSPDGRQVAFASNRRGNYDIWVTPSTGGQARPVTTDAAADDGPCWSPDGRWIVFVSNRAGSDDLWVVSASGGEPRQLTFHEADDWHPDWSPDGRWILFTSARNSLYGEVWRVPADGGEAELLTTGGYCPRYGPDGSKAYFKGSGERGDWIWEFSFFDRSQRPVMDIGGRGGTAVCWATDGQFLYLVWKESARGDIWVVDVL